MLCILYVNAIGLLLGIAGLLVERALPGTFSRRWVWCAVIAISMTIPPVYQARHTASVSSVIGNESFNTPIQTVWFTGSALIVVWGIFNVLYISRLMSRARRKRHGAPAVIDDVPVLITDSLGPATVGLLRSSVVIPRWVLALPPDQRQYVLRHEDEHRRAQDSRLLFGLSLFLILVPWNLALWWQLRRLYLAVEVDCDNRVVSALGDAPAYGELLFKVAQAGNHGPRLPRLQPAFLGGAGMLERRLKMLLAPTQLEAVQRWLLPIAACVILFVVLSLPHPVPPGNTPDHSSMESTH